MSEIRNYELRMWVDPTVAGPDIWNLYQDKAEEHNKRVSLSLVNSKICVDSGFDLFTPKKHSIKPTHGSCVKIPQGVRCEMRVIIGNRVGPMVGYYLYARSSTGAKTPLRLANQVGIIDSGYRGEIIALFDNLSNDNYEVEESQRLVQICPPNLNYPMKVVLVDSCGDLNESLRGEGGLGSTGR